MMLLVRRVYARTIHNYLLYTVLTFAFVYVLFKSTRLIYV